MTPAAGSCVLDPTIAVRGVARVPSGTVHIALLRGATVLGSTDVVVDQAGPVAATLVFDPHSLVGMVRLVVTGGSGPGGPLLASRAFGLCTTWA